MRTIDGSWMVLALVGAAACGGGGGESLVNGTATGEHGDETFTATSGFAGMYDGAALIGVGDADLDCDSPTRDLPPSGVYAFIEPPSLEVGSYADVSITMFLSDDNSLDILGTDGASVMITAATADTITATVAFEYTDDSDDSHSELAGTFEVIRCPE